MVNINGYDYFNVIEANSGKVIYSREVTEFVLDGKSVKGVKALNTLTGSVEQYDGKTVICNMDPQKAAAMVGLDKFSPAVRKQLKYEYSPSNFMAYCTVKDIDLKDYGFGKWNVFHTEGNDLNQTFDDMYDRHDYSNLSFVMTTPSFLTEHDSDRPKGEQVVEFLTVADYQYFKRLKEADNQAYKKKKKEIFNTMLDVVEKNYVPNFRQHLAFKITGSPTTNEEYCWCPEGNSYGSSMTPKHFGAGRLNSKTSLDNFYFCNASSGYAGFAGTFWTGAKLYQQLSKDIILS